MSLAVMNLESVVKLKVMVIAPAQHIKIQRCAWGGGTWSRPSEELAEAGERKMRLCVSEDIRFDREVVDTT